MSDCLSLSAVISKFAPTKYGCRTYRKITLSSRAAGQTNISAHAHNFTALVLW